MLNMLIVFDDADVINRKMLRLKKISLAYLRIHKRSDVFGVIAHQYRIN
jgi:hypothetical protein